MEFNRTELNIKNGIESNKTEWIFFFCGNLLYTLPLSSFPDIRVWTPGEQTKGDIGKEKKKTSLIWCSGVGGEEKKTFKGIKSQQGSLSSFGYHCGLSIIL